MTTDLQKLEELENEIKARHIEANKLKSKLKYLKRYLNRCFRSNWRCKNERY